MKSFFAAIILFSSLSFAVQRNPQIRACTTVGGDFFVVNTGNDEVGFCRFGKAIVGAIDLMLFENKESISQSINNYTKNETNCLTQVKTFTLVNSRETIDVCAYGDNSYIEIQTLNKGSDSADNEKLNDVLGL